MRKFIFNFVSPAALLLGFTILLPSTPSSAVTFPTFGLGSGSSAYDPTEDLINAFGSNCSHIGTHSTTAIAQSKALQEIIIKMKEDRSCDAVSTALDGVVNSQTRLNSLISGTSQLRERSLIQSKLNDSISAFRTEEDPLLKNYMATSIMDQSMRLTDLQLATDSARTSDIYRTSFDFIDFSRRALGSISQSSACLKKRPGLGIQIAGQIMAIGSSFLSSPAGPALFAGGQAINSLVNYIHDHRVYKMIKKARISTLGPALTCAIESLAANYCRARDTKVLIETQAELKDYVPANPVDWEGLRLLKRDILVYHAWVNRIIAGASPTTTAAAEVKAKAELLRSVFKGTVHRINSRITEGYTREASAAPDTIETIRRQVTEDIIKVINTSSASAASVLGYSMGVDPESPFYRFFLYDTQCGSKTYMYTGQKVEPQRVQNTCDAAVAGLPVPDIKTLEQRAQALFLSAGEIVNAEVVLRSEPDATNVVALGEISSSELMSAREFLQKTYTFFERIEKRNANRITPNIAENITEGKAVITNALKTIDDRTIPNRKKVDQLQSILAPDQTQTFLSQKLETVVRWDLSERLKSKEIKGRLAAILKDTLDDTLGVAASVRILALDPLKDDASNSQPIAIDNLKTLSQQFEDNFKDYFQSLVKNSKEYNVAAYEDVITRVCLQATLLPNFSEVRRELGLDKVCAGRVKTTAYGVKELTLDFDKVAQKGLDSRLCSMYDFQRKSRLLGIKKGIPGESSLIKDLDKY